MRLLFTLTCLFVLSSFSFALEPKDVWLIVNKNVPESRQVADHYIAKRGVPKENVVELDLPEGEDIKRTDYNTKMVTPLRNALKDKKDRVKVLVTTYGVPLRVGPDSPNADDKKAMLKLRPELAEARKKLTELTKNKAADPKEVAATKQQVNDLQASLRVVERAESQACVDSELMLLWWEKYGLVRWVMNPLYMQASETYRRSKPPVVLVSRLDGPSVDIAKRLVDDAIAVEKSGLKGKVVIDARGIKFDPKKEDGHGYAGYDESMRETAALMKRAGFAVELDDKSAVLKAGAAKDVAIYCGWYSLGKFVDCCEYTRGAIAWHLASAEAITLHKPDSPLWCPNLLKKGVCVTLGPVSEPYTVGFPKPAEFFGLIVTGEYTIVECYARSMLFCSWMTVLVGDPLYNPFQGMGKLKVSEVVPSPRGVRNVSP